MRNSIPTYAQQTLLFGEDASTFSRVDSPASRSASQENEKARKTIVTSGLKCCEQFERFDRAGSWAKTFTALLIGRAEWYSRRCVLTWRMRGMMSNRLLFRLVPLMLPTDATESGLLPTVLTQGLKVCRDGQSRPMPIDLLPTPTAIDSGSGRVNKSLSPNAKERPTLAMMARKGILLTPSASDGMRAGFTMEALRNHNKVRAEQSNMAEQIAHLTGGGTGRLNPPFVAEMMGYPIDWTESPFLRGVESL